MRAAFARATRLVWLVMLGFAGAGLLSTLLMREETMKKSLDERWGLQEKVRGEGDAERGGGTGGQGMGEGERLQTGEESESVSESVEAQKAQEVEVRPLPV